MHRRRAHPGLGIAFERAREGAADDMLCDATVGQRGDCVHRECLRPADFSAGDDVKYPHALFPCDA